ncbi:MAG: serine hydrolase domain-containing protein [Rhodanobacteraceae bacterium]
MKSLRDWTRWGVVLAFALAWAAGAQSASNRTMRPAPALRPPAGPPTAASGADVLAQILQPASAAPAPRIDPAAFAAFVDGVVRAYMTEKGIAGVTVAVADRDGPLLLRGYGVASLHPRRAVDPASTLFRIGSISKTFTYVATMQLVAAGKLDSDASVDRYLPPSLKTDDSRYPPIRIWHLMTHTAGFEDATLGAHLFYDNPNKVPALDAYLAKYKPKRVRTPAIHADYSNYSVVLLGAIVQQVSGEPFDVYIERHILTPLGMAHTTFREPLPEGDPRAVGAGLKADFSTGFKYEQGGFTAQAFEYISNGAPAGAASSDAADMAIWMRVLLDGGTVDGHEVLDPIAFREMTTPTFSNAPAVHAIAHGFFVGRYGRYKSLEHGGDTIWFHSNMVVLPEAGIGVFVSTNTDTGVALAEALPRLIFAHVLPGARAEPPPAPPAGFAKSGQVYAGTWLSERRNDSTLEKGLTLTVAKTATTRDGYLVLSAGGESKRYVEQSRDVFRALNDSDRLQFLRDEHGHITGFASAYGHVVYDRATWFDDPFTLFVALALLALTCLGALIGVWGRRTQTARLQRGTRAPARSLLTAVFGWTLFFLAAAIALARFAAGGSDIVFDYPTPGIRFAVIAAYIAAALSLVGLWFLPRAWRASTWSVWRKLRHTLIVALMLWTIVLLIEWRVLLAPLAVG